MSPFHRSLLVLLGAAVLVSFGDASDRAVDAAEDKPMLFGMATHWAELQTDVNAIVDATGKPPALYQSFWALEAGYSDSEWTDILDSYGDLGMTPYIELTTDDMAAVLSGGRDGLVSQIVDVIDSWTAASSDRFVLMAPFPEANLAEHAWGGDGDDYQAGYLRVHDAFRNAGVGSDRVRFVFAMNGFSSAGLSYDQFYPGDDVVDIVGFAKLNRGGVNFRDYDETFVRHIEDMQELVTRVKPILITQTGTVDDEYVNQEAWIDEMFTRLPTEAQVIGAIYFNRDKDKDFRIVADGVVSPAFAAGYQTWGTPSDVAWIFDGRMDAWTEARRNEVVFDDIGSSAFQEEILWVADQGITLGCGPFLYCPADSVTRGQMASFLSRALDLPGSTNDWFTDDDGSTHEASINSVADAGITLGCGGSSYCPSELVTRAQMAAFLSRALDLPASETDWFVDDDWSSLEPHINSFADAGITLGCSPTAFCPSAHVTREQMAAFLFRALS